jgi:hypothetical protein
MNSNNKCSKLTRQTIESHLFTTEIINKVDFIVIKQLDKTTGIEHKILLNWKELFAVKDQVIRG